MKKKILILAAFLLSVISATAQEPYFNTEVGRVLHYERSKAGAGKPYQTTRIQFDSVKNTPDGQRIYYDLLVKKSNGRVIYGGHISMTSDINRQNDVTMDLGQTITKVIKNYLPNAKAISEGTQAVMPSRMQPGDILPEAHAVVRAGSLKYTVDITDRSVHGPLYAEAEPCVLGHRDDHHPRRNFRLYSHSRAQSGERPLDQSCEMERELVFQGHRLCPPRQP